LHRRAGNQGVATNAELPEFLDRKAFGQAVFTIKQGKGVMIDDIGGRGGQPEIDGF
jgi:hypothetical protein